MPAINEINDLLAKILRTHGSERVECIRTLQAKIWDVSERSVMLQEILEDLAYDLNFYDPQEMDRDEDPGYYGDEHLPALLEAAIQKIEESERKE